MTGAGLGLASHRWSAARPSECYLSNGEDREREATTHPEICCDGGSTGCWGAQGRTPSWTGKARESCLVNPCLSRVQKKKYALSRKWQQEHVMKRSRTAERQGAGREWGSLAAVRSCVVWLPCTYYTFIFPFLSWETLISHSYEQRLKCKAEWTGS